MTDFLSLGSAISPDGVALTDGRTSWSYRALDDAVTRAALDLVERGVEPGDVVRTLLGPTLSGVVAVHAVRRAGGVLAPLHPSSTEAELETATAALRPRCTLSEATAEGPGDGRLRLVVDMGSGPVPLHSSYADDAAIARSEASRDAESPHAEPSSPEARQAAHSKAVLPSGAELPEVAAILWTSGTGGRRRGVEVSARGLLHVARASESRLALGPDDRWYASLHLAHVGGLALVTRAAALGSAVVAKRGFSATELHAFLDDGTVTHASLVPVMLSALLEAGVGLAPRRRVGALLVGGAHAPPELVTAALAAELPVALTYGMTEASSQVATASPGMTAERPDSVGPPLEGVEVAVAPGGEILVRGPTLALGYHRDPTPMLDADGWYHTGDTGNLDAAGHLRITGRISDRLITGGVTVDPAEVEAVLRHFPGVADCAVVGLADERWGERIVAAVVRKPGAHLSRGELEAHQGARLSPAKRVRGWTWVEAIPRNANGKVDRAAVRRLVSEGGTM